MCLLLSVRAREKEIGSPFLGYLFCIYVLHRRGAWASYKVTCGTVWILHLQYNQERNDSDIGMYACLVGLNSNARNCIHTISVELMP